MVRYILIAGIIFIAAIIIAEIVRQRIRDKAAHTVMDTIDVQKLKTQILSINRNYNFTDIKNMCPICGGILVKRNGKYGSFIGCDNYPKCKYTKKIM